MEKKHLIVGVLVVSGVALGSYRYGCWSTSKSVVRLGRPEDGFHSHASGSGIALHPGESGSGAPATSAGLDPVAWPANVGAHSVTQFERLVEIRRQLEKDFMPIIRSFGLSAEDERKVQDILIERKQTLHDLNGMGAVLQNRTQYDQALQAALVPLDRQLAAILSPSSYSELQGAFAAQLFLSSVQSGVALDMNFAGVPLEASQIVDLADTEAKRLAGTFRGDMNITENVGFDPGSGLTDADRAVLDDARRFLNPRQLEVLQQDLEYHSRGAARNR